jgi:hypothetical protein
MAQDDEPQTDYPRGRGYGHDYMRGGEVFGGYGYSSREEYERPRGEQGTSDEHGHVGEQASPDEEDDTDEEASGGDDSPPARSHDANSDRLTSDDSPAERFPQDERSGGWDVPPPLPSEGEGPPVPQIEHTFGDTGGNRAHSRSYYVTQAQLQQRILRAPTEGAPQGTASADQPSSAERRGDH